MQALWIDDTRKPYLSLGFCDCAESYADAIFMLNHKKYDLICFDHDLGEINTGYDVAKWMIEHNYPPCYFHIQSANPVGRANITQLLTHYGYTEVY